MCGNVLKALRVCRGWVATLLLAAFLVPIVLSLLPKAASSAEQVFLADVSRGICTTDRQPGKPAMPVQHDMCCVLCATGGSPPPAGKAVALEIAPPLDIRRLVLIPEELQSPRPGLHRTPAIPRGPPAA
jgi:hypothetical protein